MKNPRIYLRALEPDDYMTTYKWRQDPEYQDGVASTARYVSMETERKWLERVITNHEKGLEVRLGIVLKESEEFIGMIYLTEIDHINKNASIGSLIGEKEHRRKGYITEARTLILVHGFNELGLERISGYVVEYNEGSSRSYEKLGFHKDGVLRNAIYKKGEFQNIVVYSLLKSEFNTQFPAGHS